jgi:hypothetical protein
MLGRPSALAQRSNGHRMTEQERIAIWLSMAEHFLDSDTSDQIPVTARLCVAAGLTIEQARGIWCHEVSPAVSFNLALVAGQWGAWDEAWLLERIRKLRAKPRGAIRRLLDRRALRYEAWRSIERCMHELQVS